MMIRWIMLAVLGASLSGCAIPALPVAAWTAIGAGFGACAAACPPLINFETEVFQWATGTQPPTPAPTKP